MGAAYYISSGMSCYRASQATSRRNQSLTIGNHGPRRSGGSRPAKRKPAPVVADPTLTNALAAAAKFNDGCENGISMTELRVALSAIKVDDKNLPAVKLALTNALKNPGQWGWESQQLAKKLSTAATAEQFKELQTFNLAQGLDAAEAAGKSGINKPEFAALVEKVFGDPKGLSAERKNMLRTAVQTGRFSRQSTANLALQLASGKMSQAQAGAIFGFSH